MKVELSLNLRAFHVLIRDERTNEEHGDVFPSYDTPKDRFRSPVVATYDFLADKGQLFVRKLRRQEMSFTWCRPDGNGGWINNRKGVPHRLYVAGKLKSCVFVAEGEKDTNTLHEIGFDAASGADGAGPGKWRKEHTEQLKGLHVCARTTTKWANTMPPL